MDVFLDDKNSLTLLRAVAHGVAGLALVPSPHMRPIAPRIGYFSLWKLGISPLLCYLGIPERTRLGLLVPTASSRIQSKDVTCHVSTALRGRSPFWQLVSANPQCPSPLLADESRVYVLSPPNVVLGMAARLCKRSDGRAMPMYRSVLMLLKLCLELCGTYSHDPFEPHMGEVAYGINPLTCARELREAFVEVGGERGIALARVAADMVYDLSGSPQESCLGPALFFPDSYGGLGLGAFDANKPLDLNDDERQSIGYRQITPDFTLLGQKAVIEYLGSIHNEGANPRIDHVRSLDYATLGIREFGFWYEDVRTRRDFMESASRVVTALEQYGDGGVKRRFARLAASSAFADRQEALFQVFRPWQR